MVDMLFYFYSIIFYFLLPRHLANRLATAIKEGKGNPSTKKNKALVRAEEELNKINYDLNSAVAEVGEGALETFLLTMVLSPKHMMDRQTDRQTD